MRRMMIRHMMQNPKMHQEMMQSEMHEMMSDS
jgi:hypothetical protein